MVFFVGHLTVGADPIVERSHEDTLKRRLLHLHEVGERKHLIILIRMVVSFMSMLARKQL